MKILELIVCIIGLSYLLYLCIPLYVLASRILLAICEIFFSPIWAKKTEKYESGYATLPEILKELPEYMSETIKEVYFWIILPFIVIWALLQPEADEESN